MFDGVGWLFCVFTLTCRDNYAADTVGGNEQVGVAAKL